MMAGGMRLNMRLRYYTSDKAQPQQHALSCMPKNTQHKLIYDIIEVVQHRPTLSHSSFPHTKEDTRQTTRESRQ